MNLGLVHLGLDHRRSSILLPSAAWLVAPRAPDRPLSCVYFRVF